MDSRDSNVHGIKIYVAKTLIGDPKLNLNRFLMAAWHVETYYNLIAIDVDWQKPEDSDHVEYLTPHFEEVSVYSIFELNLIPTMFCDTISVFKSYIGMNGAVNEAINQLLDKKPFIAPPQFHIRETYCELSGSDEANVCCKKIKYCGRVHLLKSWIYYKQEQEPRGLKTFKIKVRGGWHYELIDSYRLHIVEYKLINKNGKKISKGDYWHFDSNKDYYEYSVTSYLTKKEFIGIYNDPFLS